MLQEEDKRISMREVQQHPLFEGPMIRREQVA